MNKFCRVFNKKDLISNDVVEEVYGGTGIFSYITRLEHILKYNFGLHIYNHPDFKNTSDFCSVISTVKLNKKELRKFIKGQQTDKSSDSRRD